MQAPADFHDTPRNDWTDKIMNPRHFRSYPADVRIRINLEIRIRILDHFWLMLDALVANCALAKMNSFLLTDHTGQRR